MKPVTIIILLISSFVFTGSIGVFSNYQLNKLFELSHQSNYTKEEEFRIYNQTLEMAGKNEIRQADVIRIVESMKRQRTAAHDIMEGAQDISRNMIVAFVVLVIFQIALLVYLVKKAN